ncbi:MAG: radical SAM protein, partial [Kangiellaceae bacterium]|nr:radical SAM protein [Kangiellaceae bacterium]
MNKYYHVTVLSNFSIGFDKYKRTYNKSEIKQSSYPGIFFLLERYDLNIGIKKATKLLNKLALPGNKLVVLETEVKSSEVQNNNVTETKLGQYIAGDAIKVNNVYYLSGEQLSQVRIEDAVAMSYKVRQVTNQSFATLKPRSISFLPIAKGCQAKCAFCFSAASISTEQSKGIIEENTICSALESAYQAGAERAVITGGGEPGLLPLERLGRLIQLCREYFDKTVLITNGYSLVQDSDLESTLHFLSDSGLKVLSVSRHHYDRRINSDLMSLDIESEVIARSMLKGGYSLIMRWICVLQKGG